MSQSVPLAYVRIWCNKNQLWVGFQTPQGDVYRVDPRGVFLTLPDRSLSLVNPRLIFPVIDRYPSVTEKDVLMPPNSRVPALNAYSQNDTAPLKRVGFDQIVKEVESYISLITHLPPVQLYVAVRAYENGLVSLPQLSRIAGTLGPRKTIATVILQERMCLWEDMLAICLDIPRVGQQGHVPPPAEYELVGEIMVAIGKLTRTQLQKALNMKRGGDKPLGEILLNMGACSKMDIENSLRTQQKVKASVQDRVGLLGELLVQHGIVSYDDLEQALRMQRIGRQPLHAVLISMGICSQDQIQAFKQKYPQHVTPDGFDEAALTSYLTYHSLANERQLEEARRIQHRGRLVLGELLVNLKKCTAGDIEALLGKQETIRTEARNAPQKLGEILVQHNVVPEKKVEEAAAIQQMSRQKMGTTLVNLGTCNQDDFSDALHLQFNWRQITKQAQDKLGTELLKDGHIDATNLEQALNIHARAGKPLGQILVESGSCSPESVIETLIARDDRRRLAFAEFLRENAAEPQAEASTTAPENMRSSGDAAKPGFVQKISSWFAKRTDN